MGKLDKQFRWEVPKVQSSGEGGWLVDDRSRLDDTRPYWKSERMNWRRVHTHDSNRRLDILELGPEHEIGSTNEQ